MDLTNIGSTLYPAVVESVLLAAYRICSKANSILGHTKTVLKIYKGIETILYFPSNNNGSENKTRNPQQEKHTENM